MLERDHLLTDNWAVWCHIFMGDRVGSIGHGVPQINWGISAERGNLVGKFRYWAHPLAPGLSPVLLSPPTFGRSTGEKPKGPSFAWVAKRGGIHLCYPGYTRPRLRRSVRMSFDLIKRLATSACRTKWPCGCTRPRNFFKWPIILIAPSLEGVGSQEKGRSNHSPV